MQRVREKSEGTRGIVVALLGGLGKQEVAGAASALATELLRCEGRKTSGGKTAVGWAAGGAGPGGLRGERQVSFLSSLLLFLFNSVFLFSVVCFDLI